MNLLSPAIRMVNDTHAMLLSDYCCCVEKYNINVYIKKGFVFDGASIPRFAWRVVGHPFQGMLLPSALVHDALYCSKFPKDISDKILHELAVMNNIMPLKANIIHYSVKWFGGRAYKKKSELDIENSSLVTIKQLTNTWECSYGSGVDCGLFFIMNPNNNKND